MRTLYTSERSEVNEICPICQSAIEPGAFECPKCGFKLKAKTTAFEPITMDLEMTDHPDGASAGILREVRGPQVGLTFPVSEDEITIGRNPTSTIFLNDMTVSRQHATIRNENGSYVIYDEHSYNGVWVNNKSVQAKVLNFGDKVQIGTFGFVYEPDNSAL